MTPYLWLRVLSAWCDVMCVRGLCGCASGVWCVHRCGACVSKCGNCVCVCSQVFGCTTHTLEHWHSRTHSPVARTFFCAQRAHCVVHTSSCVSHTRVAQVSVKRCLHMCRFSLSRLLPSHVSPIFAVPARSLRDHSQQWLHWRSRPHVLAVLTCPKSAGRAQLRTCVAKFGYLAKSDANTGYESKKSSTRILPWMMTRRSSTIRTTICPTSRKPRTREHWPIWCSHSVWILCFARFDFVPQTQAKESTQSENRCYTERKRRKRRFFDQCCKVDVNGKSTEQYLGFILYRLTENSILMTDFSEDIFVQAILGRNSVQRKLYSNEYNMEIQNLKRRYSEYALIESQREFESQRQQSVEINGADPAQSERICLCSRFGDEGPSLSRMLFKKLPIIWRIEKEVAIERKLQKKTTKIGRTSTQQDQESWTVVSLLSDQRRRLQERLESIEDSKIFYDPDSPSSYDNITFLIKLLLPRVQ